MESLTTHPLEEIVGKKFQLHDKFDNEEICLEGTIFTTNKFDYEFLYRIDLFQVGSVRITKDNVNIDKKKQILIQTKPSGTIPYNHDSTNQNHNLFQDKNFELRNKYLNQIGL